MAKNKQNDYNKKSFTQSISENNILSDGMLNPISATDLTIMNIAEKSPQIKNTRKDRE